nr:ATP phosphoribosyltransferase [bacterium]
MNVITLALAKGRLAEQAIDIITRCGIDCSSVQNPSRKLVHEDPTGRFRFILVKPADVPIYVARGVADAGVVGKDTLMEANLPLYEMLDLGFGQCRMCVAGFPDKRERPIGVSNLRVATKYPNIARNWYARKGETIDIIPLSGSVELGPLVGLSDVIVDIVESGSTLKANGLVVLEEIAPLSARLVVNQTSLKVKGDALRPWIDQMAAVVEGKA